MKLSIHTTITNPDYWQYAWKESIESFLALADEVIVIYGSETDLRLLQNIDVPHGKELKWAYLEWPYNFSWDEISRHNNLGYSLCTGDWVMKTDCDYVFHENDIKNMRTQLDKYLEEGWLACSFMKYTVMNKDRAYQKVHLPFILNKKMLGDTVGYGPSTTENTAWGYPIHRDEFDDELGLPKGRSIDPSVVRSTGVDCWNYDNFFKDKKITGEQFLRFSHSRDKAGFGATWGKTKEEALKKFCEMSASRLKKTGATYKPLSLDDHPKFVRDKVKNMTEDQMGYNNWNNFEGIL